MRCLGCGGQLKTSRENHNYKESGLNFVTLVAIEVSRCAGCGDYEVQIPAIDQLHRLIAQAVIMKTQRLLPEEVRFLRKRLGLSQADLALRLGVATETVNRWETGKRPMPVLPDRMLRLLAATEEPIKEYTKELATVATSRAASSPAMRFARANHEWRRAA